MKNGNKFAREGILSLPPYIPGKPIEEVKKEYGLNDVIKLASNENPLKMSPKAVEAMQIEMENCYMYPESSSPNLREKLADRLGVKPSQILIANGGDHIIGLICHAFINKGDEIIVGDPSFGTYSLNAMIMGGILVKVPLVNYTFDLDGILTRITSKTKIVFLCNPNNPTGTIVKKRDVAEFMSKVPDSCIVVFDEAYSEFVDDQDYPNGIDYVFNEENVIVLRTFSKIYGLAGIRIGYAICPDHLISILGRVAPAFPVNRIAQAAAEAALEDNHFIALGKKNNDIGRAYLCREFEEMNMEYAPSYGNYIFVNVKMFAEDVYLKLLQLGVIIRPGNQWGYHTYIRISIGTMGENIKFIDALRKIFIDYQKGKKC